MVARYEAADPFRRSYALTEGAAHKKERCVFLYKEARCCRISMPRPFTASSFIPNKKTPPLSGVLVIRYSFSMRRFAASMVSVRVPFFISTFSPWKSSPVSSSSRPPISVPF